MLTIKKGAKGGWVSISINKISSKNQQKTNITCKMESGFIVSDHVNNDSVLASSKKSTSHLSSEHVSEMETSAEQFFRC